MRSLLKTNEGSPEPPDNQTLWNRVKFRTPRDYRGPPLFRPTPRPEDTEEEQDSHTRRPPGRSSPLPHIRRGNLLTISSDSFVTSKIDDEGPVVYGGPIFVEKYKPNGRGPIIKYKFFHKKYKLSRKKSVRVTFSTWVSETRGNILYSKVTENSETKRIRLLSLVYLTVFGDFREKTNN